MKKRIILITSVGIILVIGLLYVRTNTQNSTDKNTSYKWGNYLNKNSSETSKPLTDTEIYAKGKNATISVQEMKQAIYFFEIQGNSKKDAEKLAYEYMKKSAALYAEAIEKGYNVTEEEVKTQVEELQSFMEDDSLDETSKNQVQSVIEGFDSEEEYWEYERQVYQKLLTSEKYVSDLQKEFYSTSIQKDWNTYFENYKNQLVEKEKFQIVKES